MLKPLIVGATGVIAIAAVVLAIADKPFTPPNAKQRNAAIGDTRKLTPPLQRAFDPADDFEPIDPPGPNDWLANHQEDEQTFDKFVAARPNRPGPKRNKIYFQPLGAFPEDDSPSLDTLKEFAAAFFGMEVVIRPPLELDGLDITTRRNPHTHNEQLLSTDILALLRRRLPRDAYCMLAITMEDLYPDPSWNFVFGQASLRHRVGVYSFARYDPAFYGKKNVAERDTVMLRRSCKVLAHETGHMFGIGHCIHYNCLMNGSNHLGESDSRPLFLCPVCLRKLHHCVGFDPAKRYDQLHAALVDMELNAESEWLKDRLTHIVGQAK